VYWHWHWHLHSHWHWHWHWALALGTGHWDWHWAVALCSRHSPLSSGQKFERPCHQPSYHSQSIMSCTNHLIHIFLSSLLQSFVLRLNIWKRQSCSPSSPLSTTITQYVPSFLSTTHQPLQISHTKNRYHFPPIWCEINWKY
jgi:hypothetical protein